MAHPLLTESAEPGRDQDPLLLDRSAQKAEPGNRPQHGRSSLTSPASPGTFWPTHLFPNSANNARRQNLILTLKLDPGITKPAIRPHTTRDKPQSPTCSPERSAQSLAERWQPRCAPSPPRCPDRLRPWSLNRRGANTTRRSSIVRHPLVISRLPRKLPSLEPC